ncbi:helix-turn-helix domain-containing protein [Adlercreutzia sp. R25]|uniref:helix-turn-helix domain-containing protein n=1 Tax=Adlercreutzia shanghongiae TaxID=3111773 RepID=UPI002DBD55BA|nr:helix-turn-helix domain-containing protein [Adlercreutzia sp. R25]MEC4272411.1 helix-turn-helix domain-containing protein [Adlercreutzia sp. R25]
MARQTSFGDMLASARERKGMDLSTAARKLRIRPDILRAIEESDFARMPPRGYTSNMVGAYARLVGLNPTEVTRAYRDEAYQFETGRRPVTGRGERGRGDGRTVALPSNRGASSRSSYRDDYSSAGRTSRSGYGSSSSRNGRAPAPQPQYTNLVQGRQAPGIVANLGSFLPLVIIGAIIVGLLVLVIVLAFGNRATPESDVPTVPISGMQNPAGTDTGASAQTDSQTPTQQPVAPTSAKFTYTVPEGVEAYIEVSLDGKTVEAGTVTGPKTEDFNVTDSLKFILSGDEPEAVKISVDGKEVEAKDENGRGVYTYTVNFEQVLEDWKRENGVAGASTTDNPSSDDGGEDDASSGEGASDSSDDEATGSSSDEDNSDEA